MSLTGKCSGRLDPNSKFFLNNPSCPWVDNAGDVLRKTTDDALTKEDVRQKEPLLGHGMHRRSILLIGDSQGRSHDCGIFCGGTNPRVRLTLFLPRLNLPCGTVHSAPKPTAPGSRNVRFRRCRIGKLADARQLYRFWIHYAKGRSSMVTVPKMNHGTCWTVLRASFPSILKMCLAKILRFDMVVINSGCFG
jgi:hypothetical protein